MYRIRFPRQGKGWLISRSGVHNVEAAAFYAEAILADPDNYKLLDPSNGQVVKASEVDADAEYVIENYWQPLTEQV